MNIAEDNFAESFHALIYEEDLLEGKEFEECLFSECDFSNVPIKKCKFFRCTFKECDLSLINILDSQFSDCYFERCKLIGIDWTRADWSSLLQAPLRFKDSVLNGSSFYGLTLGAIMIEHCMVQDVDFREASLVGGSLKESDLKLSSFDNTNLEEVDFRGASCFDIDVKTNTLKGATFSRYESHRLLFGLDIKLVD